MPDNYDDEKAENQEDSKLEIEDLNKHLGKRCCVFLLTAPGEPDRVLHGRMKAVAEQISMIVLRDMTPGLGPLRRTLQIPYDNIRYICQSPESDSCKRCPEYGKLVLSTPSMKENSSASPSKP
jgi:hypothetical protein